MKRIKAMIGGWFQWLWIATRIPKAIDRATMWAAGRGWFFAASVINVSPALLLNALAVWGAMRVIAHPHSGWDVPAKVLAILLILMQTTAAVGGAYRKIRRRVASE